MIDKKDRISKKELREWQEAWDFHQHDMAVKEKHAKKWGSNRFEPDDDQQEIYENLVNQYFYRFLNGEKFHPQYKMFLDAPWREGYEPARFDTDEGLDIDQLRFMSRRTMILDYKQYANDYYKFGTDRETGKRKSFRTLTIEGTSLLAMCTAWDKAQRHITNTERHIAKEHKAAYAKDAKKWRNKEAIMVDGGDKDYKAHQRAQGFSDFVEQTEEPPKRKSFLANLFGF